MNTIQLLVISTHFLPVELEAYCHRRLITGEYSIMSEEFHRQQPLETSVCPCEWPTLNYQPPLHILIEAHLIGILGDELQCGEGLDLNRLHLVLCGVHLGDDHVLVVSEMLSQVIPDRGQLLALSTPGGICTQTGNLM